MKRVGVIQSNYIPWKGYFDIIHDVDLFIFYDDVQYTKNDWRNRNRIKTMQGPHWLTIPVGPHKDKLICEIELVDQQWRKKHWETIRQSYAKAAHFKTYKAFFEHVYLECEWPTLSELNQYLTKQICCEFLGINTCFRDSREFQLTGAKQERLLDLLKQVGATSYVSGLSARAYIEDERFEEAGITLIYKDYRGYPEYPQLFPPFEHAVSIVDLLLNCGSTAAEYIWHWREVRR
jgi:hypothetical protein